MRQQNDVAGILVKQKMMLSFPLPVPPSLLLVVSSDIVIPYIYGVGGIVLEIGVLEYFLQKTIDLLQPQIKNKSTKNHTNL